MQGYYKQPELTREVFKDVNGVKYFKTGDIGRFIHYLDNDYLMITEWKKSF